MKAFTPFRRTTQPSALLRTMTWALAQQPVLASQTAGAVRKRTALLIAALMSASGVASAIPLDGEEPTNDPDCFVSGSVHTPTQVIDRWSTTDSWTMYWPYYPRLTVSWTTDTHGCLGHFSGPFLLEGASTYGTTSATKEFPMLHSRAFELKAPFEFGGYTITSSPVTVLGDPGSIEVSEGTEISTKDIEEFDAAWMQPWSRIGISRELESYLYQRNFWWGSEWMEAMVGMYDLTHQTRYLEQLLRLNEIALEFRDDRHPGAKPGDPPPVPEALPVDEFRGRVVLPAWGGRSVAGGNLHGVSEMAFPFIHSFSAFGRIVAENPSLQAQYGSKAIELANEAVKAATIFLPQIAVNMRDGRPEATLKTPDVRSILTKEQCESAYQQTLTETDADSLLSEKEKSDKKDDLKGLKRDCLNSLKTDGFVYAHNWNQWFMMGLIELWRAIDSPYYRASAEADSRAEHLRQEIPITISRMNRFFLNRMRKTDSNLVVWNYNDDLPSYIPTYLEDTGHGSLDLRGFEVLRDNLERLNAVAAAAGEPIELSNFPERIANTFIYRIGQGYNLAHDVSGRSADPIDKNNTACNGWLGLSREETRVYEKCKEVTLRVVGNQQPYLTIGAHMALLKNKRWLAPTPTPDPAPVPQPEPTPQPVPDPIPADDLCVLKPWSPGCADGNPRSEQ